MSWLLAILSLSVLIIIHEFGHYACARAMGMHVDRFSIIGIGPVVLRLFEHKGCEFVISAIPFGAYVHIVGMEAEDEAPESPEATPREDSDSSASRDPASVAVGWAEGASGPSNLPEGCTNYRDCSVWARMLAIVGGPLANYIAAMVLMVSVYAFWGTHHRVEIAKFSGESPAEAAGLQVGDVFVSIDGEPVQGQHADKRIIAASSARAGKTVDIVVERGDETISRPVALNAAGPAMNTQLAGVGDRTPMPFGDALSDGAAYPWQTTARQLSGLWAMITGQSEGKVGGPVKIVQMIEQMAAKGMVELLTVSALISTVLGMFNILPIPALDGGRFVFLVYEAVVRKPFDRMKEEWIHSYGMLILLGLFVLITINDLRSDDDEEDGDPPAAVSKPVKPADHP